MNAPHATLAPASVMQNLRVINAEQRVQLGVAQDEASRLRAMLHESQRLVSAQDARIRQLEHEVKLLRGDIDPSGMLDEDEFTFDVQVGTPTNHAKVWVSALNRKSTHWTLGGVSAQAVFINGAWVSVADVMEHLDAGALDDAAQALIDERDDV